MSNIKKIKIGQNEYGITASEIGNLEHLEITTTSPGDAPELTITSGATSNPADIKLSCSGNNGLISLNSKGNIAVESLSKHVNLEAAKSIQMKPTNNIIFDTSRRIASGNDNEVEIHAEFDDFGESDSKYAGKKGADEQYGYVKFQARAYDFMTRDHGGTMISEVGTDINGNENKIKFESGRIVSANDIINLPKDSQGKINRQSPEYLAAYTTRGDRGVEFGSFNNEHASIFTKDYRFNKDGKVYSVGRGNITTSDTGKKDYPTQGDDFSDILVDNNGIPCVWNNNQWNINTENSKHGEYIMGATWNSIVRTSNALNDQPWTDTNVSGKGNLQITTTDEYFWVELTPQAPEVPVSRQLNQTTSTDPTAEQYAISQVSGCTGIWKLLGEIASSQYYTITRSGGEGSYTYAWTSFTGTLEVDTDHILTTVAGTDIAKWGYKKTGDVYKVNNHYCYCDNTEHHLNLEGESTIKLEASHGDIEIIAGDEIQMEGSEIKLEASKELSLEITPVVTVFDQKVSKKGANTIPNTRIEFAFLNNFRKSVYKITGSNTTERIGKVRIPLDTLYTDSGIYSSSNFGSKTSVYTDSEATVKATEGTYFMTIDGTIYAINVSDYKTGKNPTPTTSDPDYSNILFESSKSSGDTEIEILAGEKYVYDSNKPVYMKDIIDLIQYMKYTNPSGPWATNPSTPWTVPGA